MYSTFCSRVFGLIMLIFIGMLALAYMYSFGKVTEYEQHLVPFHANGIEAKNF